MSPLWRNQIQVFLAPGEVNVVGLSAGIKPVQLFKQTRTWTPMADLAQWQAPLQVLEELIGEIRQDASMPAIKHGSECTFTLSNHFVRYGIVAPQSSLADPEELLAYANFQMREIYGERVDDWALSLSLWDPCHGALCAAIPLNLLSDLEALTLRHDIRLRQAEPYLAAALDHWSSELPDKRLWFVLIEPGRFCLVLMVNNSWRCVRNQRIVQPLEEELLSALEQEAIISGQRESIEQVYVYTPAYMNWGLTDGGGWQFTRLPSGKQSAPTCFPQAVETDHSGRSHA